MTEPTVSAIVINYNNGRHLEACLRPLETDPCIKEIIVVDDASTDNSIDILRRHPVRIIQNSKNTGPVAARNTGAKDAAGEFLFFIDADAEAGSRYAATLAQFLEDNDRVGVVTGKIISEHGERMWYNFGYDPNRVREAIGGTLDRVALKMWNWRGLRNTIGILNRPFSLNLAPDGIRKVDWVVEMAFMTRRSLYQKLGGMDEGFFMFFEGPDYCRRVRKAGYDVVYLPSVSTEHLGGHSHPETRGKYFEESKKRYFRKYG